MWLTINQMASPMLYNSVEDAELIAQDCPEREHERPAMAAAGKKQYEVEVTEEVFNNLSRDTTNLASSASVNAEDFKVIKASMDEPALKRKKVIKQEAPTEEELAKKAADDQRKKVVAALQLALTSLKRTAERGRKNYNDACEKANSLTAKGYPQEMVGHFQKQLKPLSDQSNVAMDSWTVYCKIDLAAKDEKEVDEMRGDVEKAGLAIEDALKSSENVRKEIVKVAK
jgi:hypothetical protein